MNTTLRTPSRRAASLAAACLLTTCLLAQTPSTPTPLNAHLHGEPYSGTFHGNFVQVYMIIKGKQVELQYSGGATAGDIRLLTGTNPESGVLRLRDAKGQEWVFKKHLTSERITWQAIDPDFGLVFWRSRNSSLTSDPLKPTPLNAHLYGNAYSGTFGGKPVQVAMIIEDEQVELQFSGAPTGGKNRLLSGTNPESGVLRLRDAKGQEWVFRKHLTSERITWQGFDPDSGDTLVFSRSRNSNLNRSPLAPTPLNAHVDGNVYFGTLGGKPLWVALNFKGEQVELQFSGARTGWRKRLLSGTNPEGVLRLQDTQEQNWEFKKRLTSERIIWQGVDPVSRETLQFSRRREDDWLNSDYTVAPESCRWFYTSDSDQQTFYIAKLAAICPYPRSTRPGNSYPGWATGVVAGIDQVANRVRSVTISLAGQKPQVIRFDPPRPLNRVPVLEGMKVRVQMGSSGHVERVLSDLVSQAYRVDDRGAWELLMIPAKHAFSGRVKPRMVISPDFFDPNEGAPDVEWWITRDVIGWNEDAAGDAMLELESISLEGVGPANEESRRKEPAPKKVPKWRPYPESGWFYDTHLDEDGPRRRVPLQMRLWSAG